MLETVKRLLAARGRRPALEREDGQALVEYALILVMITLICVVFLTQIGGTVTGFFNNLSGGL
jgi:Flp pilus assembly pilin Flp